MGGGSCVSQHLAQLESHASIRKLCALNQESRLRTQGNPRMNGSEIFES
jgi:hypothetical protein